MATTTSTTTAGFSLGISAEDKLSMPLGAYYTRAFLLPCHCCVFFSLYGNGEERGSERDRHKRGQHAVSGCKPNDLCVCMEQTT